MERFCCQGFACSGLAGDQDRGIRGRHGMESREQFTHGGAATDEITETLGVGRRRCDRSVRRPECQGASTHFGSSTKHMDPAN
jgi:hypothetical protein